MDSAEIDENFFEGRDFEDRVLYHIVNLTGDKPVGYEGSITEADIAIQLRKDLNITPDFIRSGQFHSSRERGIILAAVQELKKSGYIERLAVSGPWHIHPTRRGRNYVTRWHADWERKNKSNNLNTPSSPSRLRDAQEAWLEAAKLRRELQLAKREIPSLITDDELRRRCEDILTAENHYDRVIREACVILEDRVRSITDSDSQITGTPLMELAFSPKNAKLRISNNDQEQLGVMQLYRGTIAFFRNTTGHHLIDTYSQEDALRFVVWIDLLLTMLKAVSNNA